MKRCPSKVVALLFDCQPTNQTTDSHSITRGIKSLVERFSLTWNDFPPKAQPTIATCNKFDKLKTLTQKWHCFHLSLFSCLCEKEKKERKGVKGVRKRKRKGRLLFSSFVFAKITWEEERERAM